VNADQALIIRQGDKLVLRYEHPVTLAQADEIKRRVGELLPAVEAVILSGVAEMAVYRGEVPA